MDQKARTTAIVSFAVAAVEILLAIGFVVFPVRGGGHPPAGAFILMLLIAIVAFVSPVAILFGLYSLHRQQNQLAIWGIGLNVILIFTAMFFGRAVGTSNIWLLAFAVLTMLFHR